MASSSNNPVFINWLCQYVSNPSKLEGVALSELRTRMPPKAAKAMHPLTLEQALQANSDVVRSIKKGGETLVTLAPAKMTQFITNLLEKIAKERGATSDTLLAAAFQEKVKANLAQCAALSSHGATKALLQHWRQTRNGTTTQPQKALAQPQPTSALPSESLPKTKLTTEHFRAQIYEQHLIQVTALTSTPSLVRNCFPKSALTHAQVDLREYLKSLLTACPWDWGADQLGEFLSAIYPPFNVSQYGCRGMDAFLEKTLGGEVRYFPSAFRGTRVILVPTKLREALAKTICDIISKHGPLMEDIKQLLWEKGVVLYATATNLDTGSARQCLPFLAERGLLSVSDQGV